MIPWFTIYFVIAVLGIIITLASLVDLISARQAIKFFTISLLWPIAIPALGLWFLWQDGGIK